MNINVKSLEKGAVNRVMAEVPESKVNNKFLRNFINRMQKREFFINKYKNKLNEDFVYTSSKTRSVFKCNKHGFYTQRMDGFEKGYKGCKKCFYASSFEKKVGKWLDTKGYEYERELTLKDELGNLYRYDFWIPKENLIIEAQGDVHFNDVYHKKRRKWTYFENVHAQDLNKRDCCLDHKINIYYLHFMDKMDMSIYKGDTITWSKSMPIKVKKFVSAYHTTRKIKLSISNPIHKKIF